jgi:hypothetical protein
MVSAISLALSAKNSAMPATVLSAASLAALVPSAMTRTYSSVRLASTSFIAAARCSSVASMRAMRVSSASLTSWILPPTRVSKPVRLARVPSVTDFTTCAIWSNRPVP